MPQTAAPRIQNPTTYPIIFSALLIHTEGMIVAYQLPINQHTHPCPRVPHVFFTLFGHPTQMAVTETNERNYFVQGLRSGPNE